MLHETLHVCVLHVQVLVDDSQDAKVQQQVYSEAQAWGVQLVALPFRHSIGDKRNIAAQHLADVDIVVHWCVMGGILNRFFSLSPNVSFMQG